MGRFVQLHWSASPGALGPRRARAAFAYQAFIPDPIARLELSLSVETIDAVSRAERATADLNRDPPVVGHLEVLARRLLRSESVASSRIEGLQLSQRRLARAEAVGDDSRDETARSVLANVAAMEKAVALGEESRPLRPKDIDALHGLLMPGGGSPRTEQSWIGGNNVNPLDADFVPPPPQEVPPLMADLCRFLARTDLPAVVQAALAHAQFETIHPYPDGNGRVGRALIHVVLRQRGLAPRYVPPISLALAGNARAYVRGLVDFCEGRIDPWCRFFSEATVVAAARSVELASRFRALQERWSDLAGKPRADSSVAALIELLPAYPILSVETAQKLTGRSKQAANEAMAALERAGVLKQVSVARRNRVWEARDVFGVLDDFEREMATPLAGDSGGRRAPYPGRGRSRAQR